MNNLPRYAVVGTGVRCGMYIHALAGDFAEHGTLAALCDTSPTRLAHWSNLVQRKHGHEPVATYPADAFEKMLQEQRIDRVIVTTVDAAHDAYICRAMEAGCDAITEKPMTTDRERVERILTTRDRTGRSLRVAFNYRYAPRNSKVKELLQQGAIGDVLSVHFEWLLNTNHGADYFRRWHRDKSNSGGLMVHKATHHFDLVNWWIDAVPERVFALGDLRFYGPEAAQARGDRFFTERGRDHPDRDADPFSLDLAGSEELKALYLDAEADSGYVRDQSVFSPGISIEDDMSVMVRYRNRATMTYHLTAYSPWEGYRIAFNGSRGRLELDCIEKPYALPNEGDHNLTRNVRGAATAGDADEPAEVEEPTTLTLHRHWQKPVSVDVPASSGGGHGGADVLLLHDLFHPEPEPDPLHRRADHLAGAAAVLVGDAANRSFESGAAEPIPPGLLPA